MKFIFKLQILVLVLQLNSFSPYIHAQNKPNLLFTIPSGSITNPVLNEPVSFSLTDMANKLNYTRVWIPQKPISNSSLLNETTQPEVTTQSTNYTDGLGNSIQTITRFGVSTSNHAVTCNDPRVFGDNEYSYLPYSVPNISGIGSSFRPNVFAEQRNYYSSLYPNEGTTAYSQSLYVYDPVTPKNIKYQPGKSYVGQSRGVEFTSGKYAGTDIIKWKLVGGVPTFDGYFASNELFLEITKGLHNQESRKFTDAESRVVTTDYVADATSTTPNESTYYVYDEYDRLTVTIPPKAIQIFLDNGSNMTTTIINSLCNSVIYDIKGRVISQNVSGKEGQELVVYDRFDRPILTQDPNLHDQNKWLFKIYDDGGRVVISGILSSNEDRAYWQYIMDQTGSTSSTLPSTSDLDNTSLIYTYLLNGLSTIQGSASYPTSIQDAEILNYSFYDRYDYPELNGFSFNTEYVPHLYLDAYANQYGEVPQLRTMPSRGLLVGSKERIVKGSGISTNLSDWITNIVYYNNKGQAIQSQRRIEKIPVLPQVSNTINEIATSMFDFNGRILRTVQLHKNYSVNNVSVSTGSTHIVCQKYTYEHITFKPLAIFQKVNNQNWITLSNNQYDPQTGSLVNKKIGEIENQNYKYSIRGELLGINAPYAETGVSMPQVTFGESIKYDYGFTQPRYDGNISGIIWKTPSVKSRAYGYDYTEANRLKTADFFELKVGGTYTDPADWGKDVTDYTESNLSYDPNGNILKLKRMGMSDGPNPNPILKDDLSYYYFTESNRLDKVKDDEFYSPPTGHPIQDFQDLNANTTDYTYDKNGNLTSDKNKFIESITYNYLNQPLKISINNTVDPAIGVTQIEYVYSASGQRLEEITTKTSPFSINKRTFIGAFVYTNDNLEILQHSEGRARYNSSSNSFVYDFYIKDHLGNVRTTLTAQELSFTEYFAQHEIAYANIENLLFENIEETREPHPDGTSSNQSAARLDANSPDTRIGTAILLHVMAGDKFNLRAEAYYESQQETSGSGTTSGEDMLGSILGTLLSSQTGFNTTEGFSTAELVNGIFSQDNYINAYYNIINQNTNPEFPRSYLNYVVFDEEMKLVPEQSGAIQINQADAWHILETANDIELRQGGYIGIYISNETMDFATHFDNIRIRFYRGKLLEENHYYPFGMAIRISQDVMVEANKNLYQTKEFNCNANLNLYDFHARQYDPILARFTSIDPAGQFASGYVGMGNNPTNSIDPDGRTVSGLSAGAYRNNTNDVHRNRIARESKEAHLREVGLAIARNQQVLRAEWELISQGPPSGNSNEAFEAMNARSDAMYTARIRKQLQSKLPNGCHLPQYLGVYDMEKMLEIELQSDLTEFLDEFEQSESPAINESYNENSVKLDETKNEIIDEEKWYLGVQETEVDGKVGHLVAVLKNKSGSIFSVFELHDPGKGKKNRWLGFLDMFLLGELGFATEGKEWDLTLKDKREEFWTFREVGRQKIYCLEMELNNPSATLNYFKGNVGRMFPWPVMNCQNYVMDGFRLGMNSFLMLWNLTPLSIRSFEPVFIMYPK